MIIKIVFVIHIVTFSVAEDDNKWVWKSGGRRAEEPEGIRGSQTVGNPRYEVIEEGPIRPGAFRPPPDYIRPGKPIGIHQEPGFPDRPFPNRPGLGPFVPNERPGGFGIPGGHRPPGGLHPSGGFHPGIGDEGILTGPVPSWVKEPPFKHFDKCKCAEKFNCNSPGISYGHCDAGKQYCCYSSKKEGTLGSHVPSRPINSPENGILVGPGGPVDYPGGGPHRPYPRPPHLEDNGVLVGPGGPTGIIGRPPKGQYGHSPELGVLVGPGGPHDGPFRPNDGPFRPHDGPYRPHDGPFRPNDGPYRPIDGPYRPFRPGPYPRSGNTKDDIK